MSHTTLVPVDLEHDAHLAGHIETAAALAAQHQGRLIVLTVQAAIPEYVRAQLPPELLDATRRTATDRLRALVAGLDLPVQAETVGLFGRPAQEILRHAKAEDVDLIVIASRDPHGTAHLFGSVAAHVVRHAHCSVYVLRDADEAD